MILKRAGSLCEAKSYLNDFSFDLAVIDSTLSKGKDLSTLKELLPYLYNIPFIVSGKAQNEDFGLACLRLGAQDYFDKDKWGAEELIYKIQECFIRYRQIRSIPDLDESLLKKFELETTLETERLEHQKKLTEAIIIAQEHERRSIGIELHDNINQILASARLYLGSLKSVEKKDKMINDIDSLLNRAIHEIRYLSHSLIPPSLEESGLLESIDHIIVLTRKTGGISISRSYQGINEASLSDKLKLTIYRITQEHFNNILKHADASRIRLMLTQKDQYLRMHISDDGKGFDPCKKMKGVGFTNMKTRASFFNGEVKIQSSPGKGCVLTVQLEIKPSEELRADPQQQFMAQ